jgi:hypothetical protein
LDGRMTRRLVVRVRCQVSGVSEGAEVTPTRMRRSVSTSTFCPSDGKSGSKQT